MRFPAIPENVPRAREAIREQLTPLALGDEVLADVSIAVTEAVGNVVRHAYRHQPYPGDFEIDTAVTDSTIEIAVRDTGCGPIPNPHSEGISMGIPLMSALADTLTIEGQPGQGTTVRMSFPINPAAATQQTAQPARGHTDSREREGISQASGTATVTPRLQPRQ